MWSFCLHARGDPLKGHCSHERQFEFLELGRRCGTERHFLLLEIHVGHGCAHPSRALQVGIAVGGFEQLELQEEKQTLDEGHVEYRTREFDADERHVRVRRVTRRRSRRSILAVLVVGNVRRLRQSADPIDVRETSQLTKRPNRLRLRSELRRRDSNNRCIDNGLGRLNRIASRLVDSLRGLKVLSFKGLKVYRFKGLKVRRFKGSKV